MANLYNSAQRANRHKARIEWLKQNPEILNRLPSANKNVTQAESSALAEAVKEMIRLKLYAKTSDRRLSQWGLRTLVSEIRGERVDRYYRYR